MEYLAPEISPVHDAPQSLNCTLSSLARTVSSRPESGVELDAQPARPSAAAESSAMAAGLACTVRNIRSSCPTKRATASTRCGPVGRKPQVGSLDARPPLRGVPRARLRAGLDARGPDPRLADPGPGT